jgi:hypothetical protein
MKDLSRSCISRQSNIFYSWCWLHVSFSKSIHQICHFLASCQCPNFQKLYNGTEVGFSKTNQICAAPAPMVSNCQSFSSNGKYFVTLYIFGSQIINLNEEFSGFSLPFELGRECGRTQSEEENTRTSSVCRAEVGTRNFFLSPQSQFRNLKEVLPQSQFRNFLKKCCSATATPQFRNRNFFRSPQLQVRNLGALIPQISAHFWPWNPVDSWGKYRWSKISCYCPFKASFWFPVKQRIPKILLVDF